MLIYKIIVTPYYAIYYKMLRYIPMCYSNPTIVNMYWHYRKLVYKITVNRGGYRITYSRKMFGVLQGWGTYQQSGTTNIRTCCVDHWTCTLVDQATQNAWFPHLQVSLLFRFHLDLQLWYKLLLIVETSLSKSSYAAVLSNCMHIVMVILLKVCAIVRPRYGKSLW